MRTFYSNGSARLALPASPTPEEVSAEVARVQELSKDELRVRWRKLFRTTAPAHLGRNLLVRIIAYKIQANAFGDLDRETVRFLDQIARDRASGKRGTDLVPGVSTAGTLRPGCVLVREHEGTLHEVIVTADGFTWNARAFGSLSEVARAITGTNWNGPRFFGLRDRSRQSAASRAEAGAAP